MKKIMITAAMVLLCATTAAFAQSTTSSTDKSKTTKATGQGLKTPAPENEQKSADQSGKPIPTDQVAQKSSENDGSNRPGGATHENANDVGRYSDREDNNSMLFSREAIATRRKNLTEPDVTVKEGSGSAPKNTKNHTGTTGNYRNLATQTSGVPSRE
ncbi:hypothetical protein [Dyadobacter jiangsuensis]|uniref:Uncharacterized protein n=1 Tax=Dyadobacter jiangsuensis TaxID=1591085 RepID=A0A2P8GBG7_9BACT|nr:hypothetical protein [Dyadobacter jiangsuensis]PSL31317.1 hypothetical protein CLV60_103183 [Dyadobacter jiangsuensis]